MTRMTRIFTLLLLTLGFASAAQAQSGGQFAPKVFVNDRVVTNYEYNQRLQFMRLLTAGAATEEQALDALIDDRLRQGAAKSMGASVDAEAVKQGMAEFAGRANMSVEQFVGALGQSGVAAQTFRDFVEAGILWREIVRGRFGPRAQITEAEIDRAMANFTREGGTRVLLSEIVLPASNAEERARSMRTAERLLAEVKSESAFSTAASRHSVAQSRGRGGQMNWVELAKLPPNIRNAVVGLTPGQIAGPIAVPNAIALFQMREIEDRAAEANTLALEYARFYLEKGTQDEADKILAKVDTCDDLYGIARKLPEERLVREVKAIDEIPEDVALELARLDDNEAALLNRGATPSLVMLCARTPDIDNEADRAAVRAQLVNQRLVSYADGYLAQLRADAIIRYP